jgi:hypothetical protein
MVSAFTIYARAIGLDRSALIQRTQHKVMLDTNRLT